MNYGICPLSVVPLRKEASDASEMVSQLIYGELFEIIEKQPKWTYIQLHNDGYKAWICNKQYKLLTVEEYQNLISLVPHYIEKPHFLVRSKFLKQVSIELPLSANIMMSSFLEDDLISQDSFKSASQLSRTIKSVTLDFLGVPYLWGGKTRFGIDCSGFTQVVFLLCGFHLYRDASQQVTQGEEIPYTAMKPYDLAFFQNDEKKVTHVGIVLEDSKVIHASGSVRIDQLDSRGIYNQDTASYSHYFHSIRRYF